MFPLEGVLFPYGVMPLRIFEPRYRAMIELCLRGDGRFGVVLIERGSHVGGGDSRFDFGTVARIAEAARTPDGRYLLATVGTDRFRVKKWLARRPVPARRHRDRRPSRSASTRARPSSAPRSNGSWCACSRSAPSSGSAAPSVDAVHLDADPLRASYEAAVARTDRPRIDAYRLLQLDDPCARFDELAVLLTDAAEMFEFRLSGG